MSGNSSHDLTISSVYHTTATKELLEFNLLLTKKMNPGADFAWVVADNSLGKVPANDRDSGFIIVPGEAKAEGLSSWMRGSYHHAAGIHKTLEHIKTRFALILDSDFFLVRPAWIADVIEHMLEEKLHFFGTPYHPARLIKYRYFSSINCFFIDLHRVDYRELDFRPGYNDTFGGRSFLQRVNKRVRQFAQNTILGERAKIRISRDTGYRISKHFSQSARFDLAKPVFKPKHPISFLEKILPDRFSYAPKKPGYYSETSFAELGYPDAASFGWEEYVWRGRPFAVHLNANRNKERRNIKDELAVIGKFFPVE